MKKIFWYGIIIWFSAIGLLVHVMLQDRYSNTPLDGAQLTSLLEELVAVPMPMPRPAWLYKKYTAEDYACMADNVYHEARGESIEGQRAVVGVVIARVKDGTGRWPNSICKVIHQYKAFSWTLTNPAINNPQQWLEIRYAVEQWMESNEPFPAGNADHYHADYMLPYWVDEHMKPVTHIGAHKFYASF